MCQRLGMLEVLVRNGSVLCARCLGWDEVWYGRVEAKRDFGFVKVGGR